MLSKMYVNFRDHHRARFPEKSKAQKHITNDAMLHSGFFFRKMRVLNFFPGFTDKGK